jgi:hypothetical protein
MPELNVVEAIRDALAFEMERDERVIVLGLDVGRLGGVFRAELDRALTWAEQQPGVSPHQLFDNVYARPTGRVERQRAAFLDGIG